MEVSEIIEQVDILDYISQFCDLEQRSDGEFWGCSPLKEERTPSFSVNPEKQRFYDFSTGVGGNIIDFICRYHCCDFREGLAILKKHFNIQDDGEEPQVKRLLATSIAKQFRPPKQTEKSAQSTILSDDYMERYEKAPDKLQIWRDEGISDEVMERFQVRYDPFSDRIVHPIRDLEGNIVNVCGRTLDPNFKEKGLRKYTYFKSWGTLATIFGFAENKDTILKKGEIILFEGAKSVMLAATWGIHNTGAILTSHLNPNQFKALIKLGVNVVFALDAEVDIRQDANIMKLLPYVNVYWLCNRKGMLDEKDAPVDKGVEVFQQLYEKKMKLRG